MVTRAGTARSASGGSLRGHRHHRQGGRPLTPQGDWWTAVELGARGDYTDAWAILDDLPGSLPLSTRASHLRQIGDHAAALTWDERACATATTPREHADAETGRAADHVGLGEAGVAAEILAGVTAVDWRTATRRCWVAAEILLLVGDPVAAVVETSSALRRCARVSPRHAAKSRIMRAAARGAAGDVGGAAADLRVAVPIAADRGLATLLWPAALIAADLVAREPDAKVDLTSWWRLGAESVVHIAAHLPPDRARGFLAGPAGRVA